jgi:uncharacterized repeat protein (TIGR03803 family)
MRQKNSWLTVSTVLAVLAMALMLPTQAVAAGTYKILHTFTWAKGPEGNLTLDAAGNLYGTTVGGGGAGCGGSGCGVIWKLKPNPNGAWTVSILHVFTGADGRNSVAGLVFDAAGDLYGTTYEGGAYNSGVVFKLKPNPDGTWTESVLYSFSGAGGTFPVAGLVFDATGNLYGTALAGGADGDGVVFKLKPNSDGTWTESVLHSFTGADGAEPSAGLIFDAAGNLYGTTAGGGADGDGVVFKLEPNSDGTWTESVLHSFTGTDGKSPVAGLVFDAAGNLYGTTVGGGAGCGGSGCGVVWKLQPKFDGTWTESVLHSFTGTDGVNPYNAGLVVHADILYGTTSAGGTYGYGVAFKLLPTSSGWSETVLHTFVSYGRNPLAPVIFDPAGNLYGTTLSGKADHGLIFKITP